MRFHWHILLVLIVGMVVLVQSSENMPGMDFDDDESDDNEFVARSDSDVPSTRGFGCNGPTDHDPYECNRHCKSNGFKGGYCNAALLWFRCDCYN